MHGDSESGPAPDFAAICASLDGLRRAIQSASRQAQGCAVSGQSGFVAEPRTPYREVQAGLRRAQEARGEGAGLAEICANPDGLRS